MSFSLVSANNISIEAPHKPFPHFAPGSDLTITCRSTSANPPQSILWYKGSHPVTHNAVYNINTVMEHGLFNGFSTRSTLSLVLTEEEDEEEWLCALEGKGYINATFTTKIGQSSYIIENQKCLFAI